MYVAQERRAYILRLLQQRGSIRSATLAREIGVTDETIRTDLVDLQAQGLLQRVHGGARYILPQTGSDSSTRPDCQLAQLARQHVQAGMSIFLDSSPLAMVFVAQLQELPCTLITVCPHLLAQLSAATLPHQLICPGGTLDKASGVFENKALTAAPGHNFHPDLALLCPPAVRADVAAYHHPVHSAWAKAAAECATKTILMVPAQTLHAHAAHAFPLPAGNILITENNLPPHFSHPAMELIPYISAEDLQQNDMFDY
jgi:DeoR/GlpR family transcriptional regulator of sugar metabolism